MKSFARSVGFLVVLFVAARASLAANRLWIPDLVVPEGTTAAPVVVHCSHDAALSGFSLAIRYQPAALSVTSTTAAGTSVEGLEFWAPKVDPAKGEIVLAGVLDLSAPLQGYLAAGSDHTVARILVDVRGAAGSTAAFDLVDGLGSPPISNQLVDSTAQAMPGLVVVSGKVVIAPRGYTSPVADAGTDQTAAEGATVTVDGAASRVFAGLAAAYSWKQTGGPVARAATRTDVARAGFILPSIDGDASLTFELTVDDGYSRRTDQVAVRAIDLGLRAGTLRLDTGGAAVLSTGHRAVLLSGDLGWVSALEEGLWQSLTIQGIGAGDESGLLSGVRLYADSDGDGAFGSADLPLSPSAVLDRDNPKIDLAVSQRIATGQRRRFFLVGDIASRPAGGGGGELRFSAAGAVVLGAASGVSIPVAGTPGSGPPLVLGKVFLRGDSNRDLRLDISDAVVILGMLFRGQPLTCKKAADADDDGRIDLADVIRFLNFLFNGDVLPPPLDLPGADPTPDDLTCAP